MPSNRAVVRPSNELAGEAVNEPLFAVTSRAATCAISDEVVLMIALARNCAGRLKYQVWKSAIATALAEAEAVPSVAEVRIPSASVVPSPPIS